ncbi:leucine-rich repeat protein [Ruminococcus sp.]|uniref:leucine-rich repeat protein n=1 Tax=Ruminococcus sp. TaxID=41978 RepID=UPI0025E2BA5C|nr:leucine-rich repeat protein [Ruminococcus sp.]MCR4639054.1 leucine-rich repeat protein [Ruminococcus sp.]
MRTTRILAAVLSLTIAAGAAVPFGSYVPSYSITASAETEATTVETDELIFTVYSDHAEVSGVSNTELTKCSVPAAVNKLPVTSIAENAFYFAEKLQEVTIPSSVAVIGDTAFSWCLKLKSIKVDSSNKNFADTDGVLFNKAKDTLMTYPAGKADNTYTVPNTVKKIDSFAFLLSQNLEAVTVSASVSYIGQEAFCSGPKLRSVTILNPDCDFEISCFICNGQDKNGNSYYSGTITGYEDSTAEQLAADNNYKFIALPKPVPATTTTTTAATTTTTTAATTTTTANKTTTTSAATTTANKTTTSTTTTGVPVTTTTTAPVSKYKLGDTDGNGTINAVDASMVLQYYANTSVKKDGGLTNEQVIAADVNKDGKADAVDASIILSYYAYCGTTHENVMSFEEYVQKNYVK